VDDYEYDGYTYQLKKLGLADAKEVLAKLTTIGFFDDGLEALMKSTSELDSLERKLFGGNVKLLNDQGDFVPMGKAIAESHFDGRISAYYSVLVKAISYNYTDFLGGGWTTGLAAEEEAEE
jgi:hypothetical protein